MVLFPDFHSSFLFGFTHFCDVAIFSDLHIRLAMMQIKLKLGTIATTPGPFWVSEFTSEASQSGHHVSAMTWFSAASRTMRHTHFLLESLVGTKFGSNSDPLSSHSKASLPIVAWRTGSTCLADIQSALNTGPVDPSLPIASLPSLAVVAVVLCNVVAEALRVWASYVTFYF